MGSHLRHQNDHCTHISTTHVTINKLLTRGDKTEEEDLWPYIVHDGGLELFVIVATRKEWVCCDHGGRGYDDGFRIHSKL